jgi:hypothetical protein
MKRWLGLMIGIAALAGARAHAAGWEYLKVLNTPETMTVDYLNTLGQDCWELVTCPSDAIVKGPIVWLEDGQYFHSYTYDKANYCIFKRRTTREKKLNQECIN